MHNAGLSLLLAAAVGAGAVGPQEEAPGEPRAVVPEAIQTLATMIPGEQGRAEFRIENHGDATLEITGVTVSRRCPCEVLDYDKSIPPKGSGKLRVLVDSTHILGGSERRLALQTNDPTNPLLPLALRVEVEPRVVAFPGTVRYVVVRGFKAEGRVVQTVWAVDGTDLEVRRVESPNPALTVHFREAEESERHPDGVGRQWRVETVLKPDAPVGVLAGRILVHTTHKKQPLVSIPFSGMVRPVFAVTPPVADFGPLELTELLRASLVVKNHAVEEHKVTKVEKEGLDSISTEISPIEEGRAYDVFLILPTDMPKGAFQGRLRIHTSSSLEPVLEVEVKGTVL